METSENKRNFFRIIYPYGENPILNLSRNKYPVLDISEGGCSFVIRPEQTFSLNQQINATILFHGRGTENIKGKVVRVVGRKISIKFLSRVGISLARIMSEQRYLIRKHKMSS